MPKMLNDANTKLAFAPTIADYHAPTVAELTGDGVLDLSCAITAADFTLGATGNDDVNDPALCTSTNSSVPGRDNYEAAMNYFRYTEEAEDKAWSTFTKKGIHGFLVRRIGQGEDGKKPFESPFKAGDEVQVYEVISGIPQILSPSDAGYEKFKVQWYVQDNVDERAIVAGGGGSGE